MVTIKTEVVDGETIFRAIKDNKVIAAAFENDFLGIERIIELKRKG